MHRRRHFCQATELEPAPLGPTIGSPHDPRDRHPMTTDAAIHIVRHATAGFRSSGPTDRERELDETGRQQARDLVDYFQRLRVDQILASPAIRCRQTVAPLAEKLGLEVDEDLLPPRAPRRLHEPVVRGEPFAVDPEARTYGSLSATAFANFLARVVCLR